MGLHYAHLTLAERRTIFRLLQERRPVSRIATLLGRHPAGRRRVRSGRTGPPARHGYRPGG